MAVEAALGTAPADRKLWNARPEPIDYFLSAACLAMLVAMSLAIWRGQSQLVSAPITYPIHFATIWIALVITPVMLLRRKGDSLHRMMGYLWLVSMVTTAIASFFIRDLNNGGFSPIHLLSVLTLVVSWQIFASARRGDHVAHRKHVRGIVLGALLIAGFFTFMFNRLFAIWIAM